MPQAQISSTQPIELFEPSSLAARLSSGENAVTVLKPAIEQANEELNQRYRDNADISVLVSSRAHFIDQILQLAWQQLPWPDEKNIALVAVGGYGRGELHPHS
ncbi:MAG: hypothetical protein KJN90_02425, partial [Gammaproteobacteria bacterium]|nr:hypothetical protein [Gammaproteobacteria bacterium]